MGAVAVTPHATRRAPHGTPRSGVLLINLGTPSAPTAEAIRRYLREFLSDRRVVNLPRALWLPILYGLILPLRPRRLALRYAAIWQAEGSPLLVYSQRLTKALAGAMPDGAVALGMTYGNPSIASALGDLRERGVQRLRVLPLYPQFSHTTTTAALEAVQRALARLGWQPELSALDGYHDAPRYIEALRQSVLRHWHAQGRGEKLLISFHGIPMKDIDAGDPYLAQCRHTAQMLAAALGLADTQWQIVFQSRLGRARWTGPYTEEVLRSLAREGVKTLDVICPGFPADCLETLEEIALRYTALFRDAGGAALRYIPALNDHPDHVALLAELARPQQY